MVTIAGSGEREAHRSILAFRNAGDLRIKIVFRVRHIMVVEPIGLAVLQYGFMSAVQPFPRLIEPQHDFARLWAMQDEPDAVQRSNQMVINEQFPTRADINRFGSRRHARKDEQGAPCGNHRMVQSSHC